LGAGVHLTAVCHLPRFPAVPFASLSCNATYNFPHHASPLPRAPGDVSLPATPETVHLTGISPDNQNSVVHPYGTYRVCRYLTTPAVCRCAHWACHLGILGSTNAAITVYYFLTPSASWLAWCQAFCCFRLSLVRCRDAHETLVPWLWTAARARTASLLYRHAAAAGPTTTHHSSPLLTLPRATCVPGTSRVATLPILRVPGGEDTALPLPAVYFHRAHALLPAAAYALPVPTGEQFVLVWFGYFMRHGSAAIALVHSFHSYSIAINIAWYVCFRLFYCTLPHTYTHSTPEHRHRF